MPRTTKHTHPPSLSGALAIISCDADDYICKELICTYVMCILYDLIIHFVDAAMVSYVSCRGTMVWFLGYSIALRAVVLHNDSNLHKGMVSDLLVSSCSKILKCTILKVYFSLYCSGCQS